MKKIIPEKITPLFIGIVLKAINALLEIVIGIVLIFCISAEKWIAKLAAAELIEDPTDPTAMFFQHLLQGLFIHSVLFISIYLVIHGLIKLAVVTGVLAKKRWAYLPAIIVLFILVIFELYRYAFYTHSIFLVIFMLFDLLFIWLITIEYKYIQKHGEEPKDPFVSGPSV